MSISGKLIPAKPLLNSDNLGTSSTSSAVRPQSENKKTETRPPASAAMLKNFQKFSAPPATSKNISLNEVMVQEKSQVHLQKEQRILAKDSVKELQRLATELQIVEI